MKIGYQISDAARVGAVTRTLFGREVAVAALDPRKNHGLPLAEEDKANVHAVAPRKREFRAGRVAARRAMASLGVPPSAVGCATDRSPVWPNGVVGSISHSDTVCIAAIARQSDIASMGVDVETDAELAPDLLDLVCTGPELAWLVTQPQELRRRLGTLVFSAKESVYKCQYPLTGAVIDFDALSLRFDMKSTRFEASFNQRTGMFHSGARIYGRFAISSGTIVTASEIRPARVAALSQRAAQ